MESLTSTNGSSYWINYRKFERISTDQIQLLFSSIASIDVNVQLPACVGFSLSFAWAIGLLRPQEIIINILKIILESRVMNELKGLVIKS